MPKLVTPPQPAAERPQIITLRERLAAFQDAQKLASEINAQHDQQADKLEALIRSSRLNTKDELTELTALKTECEVLGIRHRRAKEDVEAAEQALTAAVVQAVGAVTIEILQARDAVAEEIAVELSRYFPDKTKALRIAHGSSDVEKFVHLYALADCGKHYVAERGAIYLLQKLKETSEALEARAAGPKL